MSKEDLTRPVPKGLAERAAIVGSAKETLTNEQGRAFIAEQLASHDFDGKTVCIVIPDDTRSGPHALMIQAAYDAIAERAREITILIALGTHADMSAEAIERLVGGPAGRRRGSPGRGLSTTTGRTRRRSPPWAPCRRRRSAGSRRGCSRIVRWTCRSTRWLRTRTSTSS